MITKESTKTYYKIRTKRRRKKYEMGTAPKKYKINLIQTFAGCTTVMFSTNEGETHIMQVSLKENIADDIKVIKQ